MNEYYQEIIELIKKRKAHKKNLATIKHKLAKKYKIKEVPSDIEIMLNTDKKDLDFLKKVLLTKPTRSLSGVSVIAIMTKPAQCPHTKKGIGPCIMCPGGPGSFFGNVPQSYTGKEPATRRAIRNKFDPYLQVMNRLEQYVVTGHMPEKVELIIMGGTFPSLPAKYKEEFVTYAFNAMNDFSRLFFKKNEFDIEKFKTFFELPGDIEDEKRQRSVHKKLLKLKTKTNLEKEQKKNETAAIRCVGLTIETRSDYAQLKHANEMLKLGCTRVELGIQSVYPDVLHKIQRGHSTKTTIDAMRNLKDLGFKINSHYMLGLFVTKEQDLQGMKQLFFDPDYRPDMLKLYPCMVLKGTKLYEFWKKKVYKPLTTAQAASLIAEFKTHVPIYCRIMRVQRDVPTYMTVAGVDRTNLRQYVHKLMDKKGMKCDCIRCREIGRATKKGTKITIKVYPYQASKGEEFFISADDEYNNLYGICRLRFPSRSLRKEVTKDSALVRELHVFGEATSLGKKGSVQHKGLGKELLKEAELIAKKSNKNKIVIISGIGVREYYKKLGYKQEGPYMVKKI